MESTTQPTVSDDGNENSKRRSRGRGVIVALACVMFIFAIVMSWGQPPRAKGPLKAVRNPDGSVQQSGDISGSSGVSGMATLQNANHGMTSTTVTSSSNGSLVHATSVAILNLSDHPLMERVGLQFFERMKSEGLFSEIQYIPRKKRLPDGSRLPDVFVTLDLMKWNETGLPGRIGYKGTVMMTVGPEIRRGNESVHDNFSAPKVDFYAKVEMNYEATQTGIETAAAKHQTVGEDISKSLSAQLTKEVQGLVDKYGRAQVMPNEFYPAYEAPPHWQFLETLAAEKLVDGSRFMSPSYAVWRIVTRRPPSEFWPLVLKELAETEWKVPDWTPEELPKSVRASQGADWLLVFPEVRGISDLPSEEETEDAAGEWRYAVVLERREHDLARLVGVLLDKNAPESQLLLMQNSWHLERERVEAYFQQHPPTSTDTMVILAEWLAKTDGDAARELVLRANTLCQITGNDSMKSRLEALQKQLEIDKLPVKLTDDAIARVHLPELRTPGEITLTCGLLDSVVIWLGDTKQGQQFLQLTPVKIPSKGDWKLRVKSLQIQEHGRGWSESTREASPSQNDRPLYVGGIPDIGRLEVFGRWLPENNQVELRLQRTEHASNP